MCCRCWELLGRRRRFFGGGRQLDSVWFRKRRRGTTSAGRRSQTALDASARCRSYRAAQTGSLAQ
eukprot:5874120-Pyramimonas_sp.AAC.1